jgi:hypothetical protein
MLKKLKDRHSNSQHVMKYWFRHRRIHSWNPGRQVRFWMNLGRWINCQTRWADNTRDGTSVYWFELPLLTCTHDFPKAHRQPKVGWWWCILLRALPISNSHGPQSLFGPCQLTSPFLIHAMIPRAEKLRMAKKQNSLLLTFYIQLIKNGKKIRIVKGKCKEKNYSK